MGFDSRHAYKRLRGDLPTAPKINRISVGVSGTAAFAPAPEPLPKIISEVRFPDIFAAGIDHPIAIAGQIGRRGSFANTDFNTYQCDKFGF